MLRELNQVELSVEQRAAIGFLVIHRAAGRTPGELMKLTRRLILQVDPRRRDCREEVATSKRQLVYFGAPDGQGVTQLRGPACDQAAIRASVEQLKAEHPKPEGLTAAQWEYQLVLQLLTGELRPGQWQAQVIVPFTVATNTATGTDAGAG